MKITKKEQLKVGRLYTSTFHGHTVVAQLLKIEPELVTLVKESTFSAYYVGSRHGYKSFEMFKGDAVIILTLKTMQTKLEILKAIVELHKDKGVDHERFMKDLVEVNKFINEEDYKLKERDGKQNRNM